MEIFKKKYEEFLSDFGKGRKMVLSTSENNIVSSRMMSVVQNEGFFYFQTDKTFRKYSQLINNHNGALCIDNIQIEGVCEEIGRPLQNEVFCSLFKECFKGSYDAYTALNNERLFVLKPKHIERWIYKEGVPYIETFDVSEQVYTIHKYHGI